MLCRLACGVTALAFGALLSGCTPQAEGQLDEQRNPHYLAGKEKVQAMDFKGAVASFERAVEDNPKSALAHYELGVLHEMRENDYPAALYHYNKALKLRPGGYPAENIRQRIPACRQELIKADSLAVTTPAVLRETERLREDNQRLQKQVESLQAQLGAASSRGAGVVATPAVPSAPAPRTIARPAPVPVPAVVPSPSAPAVAASAPRADTGLGAGRLTTLPPRPSASARPTSGSGRKHSVRSGETATSIARSYGVRLEALLAANPGLEPRRLQAGQTLNLP